MENEKLDIERKRAEGQEYYATLDKYDFEKYLVAVWHVLFHSSSLKKYPNDPKRALNAIDMLIAEGERRLGHSVEPAPISTFLYNRDMTNADGEVVALCERFNFDNSPDNHPDFAKREAKIFALIEAIHYYDAYKFDRWRQGKGYHYSDGDHEWMEYQPLGNRGENLTLPDIEWQADYGGSFYGVGKDAVIPFKCSGEYNMGVSGKLRAHYIGITARTVHDKGLDALPKEKMETIMGKISDNPENPEFVKEHIKELFLPKNRYAIEQLYKILNDRTNYR